MARLSAPSRGLGKYALRLACLLVVGILSTTATSVVSEHVPDERILRLDAFFDSYRCPAPNHAAEYVRAADAYHIDYRILPAISLLESTCGSYQRLNNHWGWNSARTGFPSVPHGIDFISNQFAHGGPYKGRALEAKLYSYNPKPAYVVAVKRLMRKIQEN